MVGDVVTPVLDWEPYRFAEHAATLLARSTNSESFCQILVLEVFRGTSARGALVAEADSRGRVDVFGSFGYEDARVIKEPLAIWDERAVCKAIRENTVLTISNREQYKRDFPNATQLGLPGVGFLAISFGRERGRYCALGVAFDGDLDPRVASSPAIPFIASITSLVLLRNLRKADSLEATAGVEELVSTRQKQITELVMQGCTNSEIGTRLHISESLVKQELGRTMRLLEVKNRRELARRAVDFGIVERLVS